MKHIYADDGRILTSPKKLKPLLKGAFLAFSKLLGHIRFFIWRMKFGMETKGVSGQLCLEGLTTSQRDKIHCGAEHFRALYSGVVFSDTPVRDWREFKINA